MNESAQNFKDKCLTGKYKLEVVECIDANSDRFNSYWHISFDAEYCTLYQNSKMLYQYQPIKSDSNEATKKFGKRDDAIIELPNCPLKDGAAYVKRQVDSVSYIIPTERAFFKEKLKEWKNQ